MKKLIIVLFLMACGLCFEGGINCLVYTRKRDIPTAIVSGSMILLAYAVYIVYNLMEIT